MLQYPQHVVGEVLMAELEFVEKFLGAINSPIVFSHNDLQVRILDPKQKTSELQELALSSSELLKKSKNFLNFFRFEKLKKKREKNRKKTNTSHIIPSSFHGVFRKKKHPSAILDKHK